MNTHNHTPIFQRLRSNVRSILQGKSEKMDLSYSDLHIHTIQPFMDMNKSTKPYEDSSHITKAGLGISHITQPYTSHGALYDRQRLSYHPSDTQTRLSYHPSDTQTRLAPQINHQCFHLHTPVPCPAPQQKQKLNQSLSLPAYPNTGKQGSKFCNRPLPRAPDSEQAKQLLVRKSSEGSHSRRWRKEPLRRSTAHSFPPWSYQLAEDHIYEEIEEESSESEGSEKEHEENSFLSLISTGRRQNLKYYGCTGWDFGS